MKKLLTVLLTLAMIFALAGCSSKKEDTPAEEKDLLAEIQERGYITIATEGDWSPWTYHNEAGDLVGYDVEIGAKIAEYLGVEASFEETAWDSILAGVDSGRFDIACNGVGYTAERAEKYNFSDAYVFTKKVLIVLDENTDITEWESLEGKTTGNTASSTYAAIAESYGATVTPVDDFVQTIELLSRGDIDATINAEVSYLDYIAQHPEAPIKVVAKSEGDIVAFPMQKSEKTATLVEAVNNALQAMRDSGELAELSVKYFGDDLTNR